MYSQFIQIFKGIGSFLLKNAVKWAQENNCNRLYLLVQQDSEAVDFYTAKNFQTEKIIENYYLRLPSRFGEKTSPNALKMCLNL